MEIMATTISLPYQLLGVSFTLRERRIYTCNAYSNTYELQSVEMFYHPIVPPPPFQACIDSNLLRNAPPAYSQTLHHGLDHQVDFSLEPDSIPATAKLAYTPQISCPISISSRCN